MAWKRIRTGLLVTGALAVAAPILLNLAFAIALSFPIVQKHADREAERLLGALSAGQVSLQGFRTDMAGYLGIEKLLMRGPDGGADSVEIKDLRVRYSILDLIQKRVRLDRVAIGKVALCVTKSPEGEFSWPLLRKSIAIERREDPTEGRGRFRWVLAASSVQIGRMEVFYHDSATGISGAVRGAEIELDPARYGKKPFRLRATGSHCETPWWSGNVDTVEVTADISKMGLRLKNFSARTAHSKLKMRGWIPLASSRRWRLSMDGKLAVGDSVFPRHLLPRLARGGVFSVNALLHGTRKRPRLSFGVQGLGLRYNNYSIDTISMTASYDNQSNLRAEAFAKGPVGSVAVVGKARIMDPSERLRPAHYTIDADIRSLRLSRLRGIMIPDVIVNGTTTHLRAHVAGESTELLPTHATIATTVRGGPFAKAPLCLNAALDSSHWSMRGEWGRNILGGKGRIDGGIIGQFHAYLNDPGIWTESSMGWPMEGTLNVNAHVSGPLRKPRLNAEFEGVRLRSQGLVIDTVSGSMSWRRGKARFRRVRATVHGALDSL
ncbi:MAG: hypothetical protein GF344_13290, partial [Chitinivibrionales bacterium]|nr:hypothetical protein [Chitinivibrionales bacterium]MBD3357705.1 hypothetical protein [Chitinivibrionales bacterium]